MPFTPPNGVAFRIADEIPVADLCTEMRRVVVFLQNLTPTSPSLQLYDDWWEHDGLHFDKGCIKFHELFSMVETPRTLFDATPDDHAVFVGVAPEGSRWYLRFRAEWGADEKNIVGRFDVILPSDLVAAFTQEVLSIAKHPFEQVPSESYYKGVIV